MRGIETRYDCSDLWCADFSRGYFFSFSRAWNEGIQKIGTEKKCRNKKGMRLENRGIEKHRNFVGVGVWNTGEREEYKKFEKWMLISFL